MRLPRSIGSHLLLAVNFLLSGVLLCFVFVVAPIVFTDAVSHGHDLSPEAHRQLQWVSWWLCIIPAAWLVALLLAGFEAWHQNRCKQLVIYILLPLWAAVVSIAVAWVAVWAMRLPA